MISSEAQNKNRLGGKKYYAKEDGGTREPRKPCSGCGGEKFEPPQTPQEIERLLAEHIQP